MYPTRSGISVGRIESWKMEVVVGGGGAAPICPEVKLVSVQAREKKTGVGNERREVKKIAELNDVHQGKKREKKEKRAHIDQTRTIGEGEGDANRSSSVFFFGW